MLAASLVAGAPLNVTSDTDLPEDTTTTYDSISVSNGAVLTIGGGSGITVTGAVTITGNSSIVFAGKNVDAQVGGAWVGEGSSLTAASVTVDAGSAIHADGQGYPSGKGPGAPLVSVNTTGASYGGSGTAGIPANIRPTYGSVREPVDLGSASGVFNSTTNGGGAIRLDVSGTLTVAGRISADGTVTGNNHSGATGGSIWITTTNLAGVGTIRANAVAGGAVGNSDSGGGRIAIEYVDAFGFSNLSSIEANGSDGSQDGTVFLARQDLDGEYLTVTNRLAIDAGTTANFNSVSVLGGWLEMESDATLMVDQTLELSAGSLITVDWETTGGRIETGNLVVAAGARISADGFGYSSGGGPGGTPSNNRGAGHGGSGGGASGGLPYGDSLEPTTAGSASFVFGSTTHGGGVIRVVVGGTLTLNGLITANGTASGTNHSGATGGSIWVTAPTLKGSGFFQADASPGGTSGGNSDSSGGRVAVYFENADDFSGFSGSSASAGSSDAVDGTIVFVDTSGPNPQLSVFQRLAFPDRSHSVFGNLHFADAAQFDVGEGSRLVVNGDLHLGDGSHFDLGGGSNLIVSGAFELAGSATMVIESTDRLDKVLGVYQGSGSTLVANNLLVESGSSITADGQGYPSGKGPGASTSNLIGASHGGLGFGASAPVYGDPQSPVELGSSSGVFNSAVAGGGAIRVVVPGEMVLDGTISANGVVVSGTNHAGASGGSVWIEAGSLSGEGLIQADASPKGLAAAKQSSAGGRISISTVDTIGIDESRITANPSDSWAEPGTVELQAVSQLRFMEWLTQIPDLVFGELPLAWALLEPGVEASSVLSVVDGDSVTILTEVDGPNGSYTWDTESVADGTYTLVVTFLDAGDNVVGELSAEVFVANDFSWHFGEITEDEIWTADRLNIISNNLTIKSGATVTVEEGAVVKVFFGVLVSVESGGAIAGIASESSPIIFTSIFDDSIAGDTNQDGSVTSPIAGDWRGFDAAVGGQLNLNEWVDLRYTTEVPETELTGLVTWPGDRVQWIREFVTVKTGSTLTIKAGAIIKFGPIKGIVLEPGATLVTEGTVAQPVIFTSEKDDQRGGDTNGDGDTTTPTAGDWRWIYVDGATASFDHTEIRYGGGGGAGIPAAIRTTGEANVTVDNSVIADALFDGIVALGGPVMVRNCVFTNIDRAISADRSLVTVRNSTFDRNRIGILMHGGAIDVANSIIANSLFAGLLYDFGQDTKTITHTLFYNPRATMGNISGTADVIGTNGNLMADPGFLNALGGEFRLQADSPAIDAADTSKAPELDRNGAPRFNEPSVADTGVPGEGGVIADMGAYEFADGASSEIDLLVTAVNGPDTATVGESAMVSWTVRNDGSETAMGPWIDEVQLVANPGTSSEILRPSVAVLVGENVRLAPGGSVVFSKEIRVPGTNAGLHRWKVTTNEQRTLFEGTNRENNAAVSASTTTIDLSSLVVGGESRAGVFQEVDDGFWFLLDTRDEAAILSAEAEGDDRAITEIFWAVGRLPSPTDYDGRQGEWRSDDVSSFVAPGSFVYVLVRAGGLSEPNVIVAVSASPVDFRISKVSPLEIGDSGTATLAVGGAELDDLLIFELVSVADGKVYPASEVFSTETNLAYPTFPMKNVPRGEYRVRASRGGASVESELIVTVEATIAPKLEASLNGVQQVRGGRDSGVTIQYRNVGNVDLVAPVMETNASIRVKPPLPKIGKVSSNASIDPEYPVAADEPVFTDQFLAISGDGPAGILRPASPTERYVLSFTAPFDSTNLRVGLLWLTPEGADDPFPWSFYKESLRPPGVPDEGWDKVYELLENEVGETMGGINATASRNATQMSRAGQRDRKFLPLVMQTLSLVDPSGWVISRGRSEPMGSILPDFTKNTVSEDGPDFRLVTLMGGNRVYESSGTNNLFVPSIDDGSLLSWEGDHYELEEFDGLRVVFAPNGDASELMDGYGNVISFHYEDERLSRISKGDTDLLQLEWGANGKVSSLTKDNIETTLLRYDARGRLIEVENPYGFISGTEYYDSGPKADLPKRFTTNSGELIELDYDEIGRLSEIASGLASMEVSYPAVGEFVRENNEGDRATTLMGSYGELRRVDFNGKTVYRADYNELNRTGRETFSGGRVISRNYDEDGRLIRLNDPMGNSIFTEIGEGRRLESITDPLGRTTRFSYDAQGSRIGVTNALGGTAGLVMDDQGRISEFNDFQGRTFKYTYDDDDLLVERLLPGGAKEEFEYDGQGRLISAKNVVGATTLTYFENGLINRVTFPNDRWIEYIYDSIGRLVGARDDVGYTIEYRYGSNGWLEGVADGNGDVVASFEVDPFRRLVRESRENGTETIYDYDDNGFLASVSHRDGSENLLSSVTFDVDEIGQRTRADFGDYAYDFEYDAYGQMTKFTEGSETHAIRYDAAGNRERVTEPGLNETYVVDGLDRYVRSGSKVFEHDASGNMTRMTDGADESVFDYDPMGRLIRIQGPSMDVRYEYDALGNRVAEVSGGVRTEFLPNLLMNSSLFAIHNSSGATHLAYAAYGYVLAEESDGSRHFFHYDGNGNTIRMTDDLGAVANRYDYLPDGRMKLMSETIENRFRFAGQHGAVAAPDGRYWIQSRTYDPAVGRFLSPDIAASEGENPYTYAANQPSNRVDFDGRDSAAGDALGKANSDVSKVNFVKGVNEVVNLDRAVKANETAQTGAQVARTGFDKSLKTYEKTADFVDSFFSAPDAKVLKNRNWKKVEAAKETAIKAANTSDEAAAVMKTAGEGGKFSKRVGVLGTGLTWGQAVYTLKKFNDGEATLAQAVHDVDGVIIDGLGYFPPTKVFSLVATGTDIATQAAFPVIADWWYRPKDPFGPGIHPRKGQAGYNPRVVSSYDPNDKSATGVGEGGYVDGKGAIEYLIRFENVATASAAAQQVRVTDLLSDRLDWSTFEILEFGFNGTVIVPPPGADAYSGATTVDTDPNPVQCEIHLNPATGELTVDLKSFDEQTGDWPEDALAGFLPPNDETGRGEGYIRFAIWPVGTLSDGEIIENQASIVFDSNEPIITNVAVNTIDTTAPDAEIVGLRDRSAPTFTVTWEGDDAGGSGVERFDVYVSVDGGDWTLWQDGTAETSADYQGTPGSSYAFYVHATDALGFANPVNPTAQAQTIAGVSFLVNISNRGGVGTGPNIMIPGFVIDGSGTKKVLVRAVGPTLGGFGVQGTLEDPQLTVVSGGADIAANDNWSDAPEAVQIAEVAARVGAFPLETESGDAAALLDLEAGSYTVKVSGVAQGTGVALVELYDTDESANPSSKLVNISNRGEVGVGSAIMIPGFVVGGETPKTVLIRGVGPKLGDFGVQGVLEDPTLGVFRSGEADALYTNDNWGDAANAGELAAATASVGAFALEAGSKDAAVLVTLEPGAYTVKVSGVDGTEGVALVEIYEVQE